MNRGVHGISNSMINLLERELDVDEGVKSWAWGVLLSIFVRMAGR